MDCLNWKERATHISVTASSLSDEFAHLGLPEPSFERGLPTILNINSVESEAGVARQKLLQMLNGFLNLLTELTLLWTPELAGSVYSSLRIPLTTLHQRNHLICLHSIVHLSIAEHIPPQGVSIQDLGNKFNIGDGLVWRLLAHSNASHILWGQPKHFCTHCYY
jgi:hypothetical protein